MSQTRRATLVAVLQGTNGYSINELNAMNAVGGVTDFLNNAQSAGLTHTELADKLIAFKTGGGAGLANAIRDITDYGFTSKSTSDACNDAVAEAKAAVLQALDALNAVT